MKIYKRYNPKSGSDKAVTLDGQRRWINPEIRPPQPQIAVFRMLLGGEPAPQRHDRIATFGKYDNVYIFRIDDWGCSTIELFTRKSDGQKVFNEWVDSMRESENWQEAPGEFQEEKSE